MFEDYARLLGDVPLDIWRDGLDSYLRKGKWFPKLAELLEHINPLLAARQIMRRRLQDLEKAATDQPPPRKIYAEMTPEEQAEWDRNFARLKAAASGGLRPVAEVARRVTEDLGLLLPPGSAEPF